MTCREELNPEDPDVVHAFEVVRTEAFGVGVEEHEGRSASAAT